MLNVSVVVPTYRSGAGLDRLIASLDAQTMPSSEFEVIFIDDGSPDDTYARLLEIQATRPHVRVERIENSGWPSRPRNIGTDMAIGEYVVYMDHDDLLYPDALRAAYAFAKDHDADVVNGKETRTHDAAWAIDTYRADLGQSVGQSDRHPLIPMNPHKLYRRAFLDDHGIRFREGGRVMWEDIFFNLLVDRHAQNIATLSSVPFYHWYMTEGSGSKGFLRSSDEFWHWLREVLSATIADLDGAEHATSRSMLLAHQYRSRILGSFNAQYTTRPPSEQDKIYEQCRSLQHDFSLSKLDDHLNASGQIRAKLLAAGERDLLEHLPRHDPGIPGWGRVTTARWSRGRLELDVHVEWSSTKGRRHALRRVGDRIIKVLPTEYRPVIAEIVDVTAEVRAAMAEVGLRSRSSRVTWMAPTTQALTFTATDDQMMTFDISAQGIVDVETIVFGRPLEDGLWDLNVRCTLAGSPTQQRMRSALEPSASVHGGRLRMIYTNADGTLTLSLGRAQDAVARLLPAADAAVVRSEGGRTVLTVPLEAVDVDGEARFDVKVPVAHGKLPRVDHGVRESDFETVPAQLVVARGRLIIELDLPDGRRPVRLRIGAHHPRGREWWSLSDEMTPGPPRLEQRRTPGRTSLWRRVVRRAKRAVRRLLRG